MNASKTSRDISDAPQFNNTRQKMYAPAQGGGDYETKTKKSVITQVDPAYPMTGYDGFPSNPIYNADALRSTSTSFLVSPPPRPVNPPPPTVQQTDATYIGFEGIDKTDSDNNHKSSLKQRKKNECKEEEEDDTKIFRFRDGKRRIDYILAYEPNDVDELRRKNRAVKREQFEKNLKKIGLELEREDIENSVDGKTVFVKVHIPWKLMCKGAEELKIKMPLLREEDLDGGSFSEKVTDVLCCCCINPFELDEDDIPETNTCYTCAFRTDKMESFIFPENKEDFFSNAQRGRVVHRILMKCRYNDRKNHQMGINRLISNGSYTAAYPLHDGPYLSENSFLTHKLKNERQILYYHWARPSRWYKEQPLDLIRKYFGEKIGLYFAWLGFYTVMLIPAAIMGLFVIIYGLATMNSYEPIIDLCERNLNLPMCPRCDQKCDYTSLSDSCIYTKFTYILDNTFTVAFAIFMSFWATFFLEFWKRKEAVIQYDWDMIGFEDEEEQPRPEFEAAVTTLRLNPITQLEEPFVPNSQVCPRYTVAINCILLMIAMVIIAILSVVVYRIAVYTVLAATGTLAIGWVGLIASSTAAIINLVCIMLLNKVYERLAYFLTEWEMPKTQTMFDDLFTFKMYLFQFVNFYGSLFYIAFFKLDPGTPDTYHRIFGFRREECDPAGCLFELGIQLMVIMVGKQLFNNFIEIIVPKIKNWWRKRDNIAVKNDGMSQWELDYDLVEKNQQGLFYEYLEMVIQFGFITIFVAAFPLGPLFALLNNLTEIRVDAYKFITIFRRPMGERTEDIGIWFEILSGIVKISVVVNAFVIAFVSEFVPRSYYEVFVSADSSLVGFLNSTLSCFDISDYNLEHEPNYSFSYPNNSCGFDKQTCRYRGYHQAPFYWNNGTLMKDTDKYELSHHHWHIITAKLCFVIIFEHLVFVVSNFIAWVIPDIPSSLSKQIKRENYLAKQAIHSELPNDYLTDSPDSIFVTEDL